MKQSNGNRNALSEFGRLVRDVVQRLVDYPEDVEIQEIISHQTTVLEILVRRSDHGKLVGRAGANVNALRQIATCVGGRDGRRYDLELLEDPLEDRERPALSNHPSLTDDVVTYTSALLGRIVQALVDEPRAVHIEPLEGTATAMFEIRVAPNDVRRVLGKKGATADALRRLLLSMGGRENRKFILNVVD